MPARAIRRERSMPPSAPPFPINSRRRRRQPLRRPLLPKATQDMDPRLPIEGHPDRNLGAMLAGERPPVGQLGPLDWLVDPRTMAVMTALTAEGGEARFVGGCVRDSLLRRNPLRPMDIDIATTERPERVIALIEAAGLKAVPTGLAHGTLTVVAGGKPFEVTTLRRDTACDGRHAEVAFSTSFREDASRRDFTINALSADREGRVFDYFDGISDLHAGWVRFIGRPMDRIAEDYLRILRFFRFHARFGRPPADPDALSACAAQAAGLDRLSAERVRSELLKILDTADPAGVLMAMRGVHVLERVLPEAGDVTNLRMLTLLETRGLMLPGLGADPLRRLACVVGPTALSAVAGPPALSAGSDPSRASGAALGARLRLSRAETARLTGMLDAPAERWPDPEAGEGALRRLLDGEGKDLVIDRALLRWAGERGKGPYPRAERTARWRVLIETALGWTAPTFPLGGRDALACGLKGPAVGEALAALRGRWLEGGCQAGRDEMLAWLATWRDGAADKPPAQIKGLEPL
ncbi:polynucleotide adenylyltransferase [Rhodospirillum rubrum]|nr:polynucleotide adenylyltransferase [Rhodospirillum rubrum]MBK1676462.1 polynucleotide adenylyltransferase [Rhodospirillum rubrum]